MSFEYDIFISYGWVDDEDPAGDMKGWVDLLVERLPRVVASYLGDKPRLWRDERSLRGNDLLSAAINDGVTRSRLFVPIVSPRYVLSEWCRKELEAFCATGATAGAGQHRSRIFKVVKTPLLLPHLKEPEALRELIGYSFYEMEGDRPREFSPDVVPAKDQRYWDALGRLAWDITNTLVALRSAPPVMTTTTTATTTATTSAVRADITSTNGGSGAAPKFVYLAESTSDLAKEREQVRDELRQRGYEVLPEQRLPLEERRKTEEAVRQDLARCTLSVHMVGARYGSTPEDDPASIVQIQEQLAAERGASDPAFRRVLWMPPGLATPALEVSDARQKAFVAELQTRITAGAELLQTTVEDLKTRVVERLTAAERTASEMEQAGAGAHPRQKLKQVYLICENSDRSFVRPIRQYLHSQKFEVITWLEGEGGTAVERLMEYHRKNLRECDAALIYFGSGDEPWVRKNLEDLEKAYGYGREDDWSASAVYVGAPANPDKEDFLTNMVPYVIHNFDGFNPDDLRDFVKAVREAEGGA
ncbi:MAG TPA: TIR domain-containing protein [Pyrinomonadaceae bacterium]|nr:TIR domain-containing protein [Pyrinomonadaceae bacterium]